MNTITYLREAVLYAQHEEDRHDTLTILLVAVAEGIEVMIRIPKRSITRLVPWLYLQDEKLNPIIPAIDSAMEALSGHHKAESEQAL